MKMMFLHTVLVTYCRTHLNYLHIYLFKYLKEKVCPLALQ